MSPAAVRRSLTLFEAEVRPRLRFPVLAEA
jgi:hypothetical protein